MAPFSYKKTENRHGSWVFLFSVFLGLDVWSLIGVMAFHKIREPSQLCNHLGSLPLFLDNLGYPDFVPLIPRDPEVNLEISSERI